MNHHYHTLCNGIAGMTASFGAVITTFQTQLEWWVRMTGGLFGLAIAGITLYNLIRKL
jgi:hypothetical protein